ncbi:ammonia-forming cytochrome c nitrite reductase subunit c552 [Desulfitobacterium sp. PCE1]|uniref:ammonia-forming cytochrome c nitrite reductase subunit c552 n=1 Tax=Desulfitobacterium sp. PCE1 TaxID=146907 RepID=UPI000365701F|nr:ammonia-forming cytochrome c nitrite reductase subunit c552 [Desulfitobacterium sp. PCE1]
MRKGKILIGLLAAMAISIAAVGCSSKTTQPVAFRADIAPGTLSVDEYAKYYPKQYDTFVKTKEMSNEGSKYGGSEEFDKLTQWPFLKEIFAGYGFAIEYNEDRGHAYTIEDVTKIKRINEKSIASCWTCKSANVAGIVEEMGDAYYGANFHDLKGKMTEGITCANCHDPQTMNLVIVQPPLRDALTRLGKDPDNLTTQELRTMVCAQCHVEYYFAGDKKIVTFPWDKGLTPNDVLAYYEEIGFSDWKHPKAGVGEIKAQHPEYETFMGSTHAEAGLSCADCHMPYTMNGGEKISSHWWTSPLKHMNESCMTCHREGEEKLKERVFYTQDKVADMMGKVGNINVEAIEAIAEADAKGANQDVLNEARALQRKGQFLVDWVGAENSMGFHNPQLTMETLNTSMDYAYQAISKATEAVTGVATPKWDVKAPKTNTETMKIMHEKESAPKS